MVGGRGWLDNGVHHFCIRWMQLVMRPGKLWGRHQSSYTGKRTFQTTHGSGITRGDEEPRDERAAGYACMQCSVGGNDVVAACGCPCTGTPKAPARHSVCVCMCFRFFFCCISCSLPITTYLCNPSVPWFLHSGWGGFLPRPRSGPCFPCLLHTP